ncbi:hypothetical protein GUJ93_ZPchr0014g46758 [Zizania palustris]|uniref:BHLH domain-containing protein n=1 Tax=Zizania palustris TaxID=103762 RepID=A0A8J5VV08_ZIZPA|nr:hypothetical protein GUJ93_ZPchr0014g46758 [Zizania palustris]
MNNPPPSRPQPQRGGMQSRYGGGGGTTEQGGGLQSFFTDTPLAEGAAAAARTFFPVPGGVEQQQPPSASTTAAERAMMRQRHYGGGAEISLGHGHGHGHGHSHAPHHFHQFGLEAKPDDDAGGPSGLLTRHPPTCSPPGFFSSPVVDNGFSSGGRAGLGEVRHGAMSSNNNNKKLKNPFSFAGEGSLSQISEDAAGIVPAGHHHLAGNLHGGGAGRSSEENIIAADHVARSFSGGFSIGSWEDSNSIVFSTSAAGKPAGVHGNDDIVATISNYESQLFPREMSGVEKYMQMQQDQVPFRVRAKRGCATHPRSIAERERRTRISEKLRKLQALVPNMDKQTSTSDMLDLAVDHIKGLQNQLQTLKEDKEKCTCRSKQASRNINSRPAD